MTVSSGGARSSGASRLGPVRVGLLGIGTVGAGTFNVLSRNQHEITRRAGRGIEIGRAHV
jgi:homoserine dehydrogenase